MCTFLTTREVGKQVAGISSFYRGGSLCPIRMGIVSNICNELRSDVARKKKREISTISPQMRAEILGRLSRVGKVQVES